MEGETWKDSPEKPYIVVCMKNTKKTEADSSHTKFLANFGG